MLCITTKTKNTTRSLRHGATNLNTSQNIISDHQQQFTSYDNMSKYTQNKKNKYSQMHSSVSIGIVQVYNAGSNALDVQTSVIRDQLRK